jgi:hypothetical protein
VLSVVAAVNHVCPDAVLWKSLGFSVSTSFLVSASARDRWLLFLGEIGDAEDFHVAAGAPAFPVNAVHVPQDA